MKCFSILWLLSIVLIECLAINPRTVADIDEDGSGWNGTIWVVLVAGSRGWYNYRHQADICHAYQVIHEHGVPDKNIIVMMFDDIAHNEENPTPGIVINRPNGSDVYKGGQKSAASDSVIALSFIV